MPELGRDPIELLLPDPEIKERWLSDKIMAMSIGGLGFLGACYMNWAVRKPMLSGVQKHIALTVGGAIVGQFLETKRAAYYAEKDAVLRHYIELHPEHFPRTERKKIKELLEPWIPIR
uniref:NADH dehydrogenase [ubiquinone] 1 subunit C2 n=1 Tax=Culicoides sonorensis TaxID=179676 RepID=A0A336L1X5_CULSO